MKINDWNSAGARSKRRPKNRCKDEVINGIKRITEKVEPNHQILKSLEQSGAEEQMC
jgi:hypothetical protein